MREAIVELGREVMVTKVSDISEIVSAGIISTPAVAIDGEVKCSGKVPTKAEVKSWLSA